MLKNITYLYKTGKVDPDVVFTPVVLPCGNNIDEE